MKKWHIIKNLLLLNVGCLLFFASFEGLLNLQSTMNSVEGMGTTVLVAKYIFFIVFTMVLPTLLIKKLGCKCTLIVGTLGYLPYTAANFYLRWWIFLPAGALCGIAAAAFWSARATYVNGISAQYALHTESNADTITSMFFGVSSMFYSLAQAIGNLISFVVLRPMSDYGEEEDVLEVPSICGASFCNDALDSFNSTNIEPPSEAKRYILTGIYTACVGLSALTFMLGLDPLAVSAKQQEENLTRSSFSLVFAALRQVKKRNQMLLLPVTFHIGLGDGFLFSEFSKAYVGCSWGIHHIGYVLSAYGIICALMSAAMGHTVKYLGQVLVFSSGYAVSMAIYTTLLFWNPDPEYAFAFFLITGAWGYCDAIWWAQINALYGTIFKKDEEAAFSNFYFWNSAGFLVAFAMEKPICAYVKLYILLFIVTVGIIGLLYVVITTEKRSNQETYVQKNDTETVEDESCGTLLNAGSATSQRANASESTC